MARGLAADMPVIETAEQYREGVAEALRLQTAPEGSAGFKRRQALRAALADYELRHDTPECNRGRPG